MSIALHKRMSLETALNTLSTELIGAFMDADPGAYTRDDAQQLLRNYIRHVARCGLAAGRSGFTELQDYCVQFQAILKGLLEQPAGVISEYQGVLEQWPLLLMSYMNATQPQEFAAQIEELIAHTAWPSSGEIMSLPAHTPPVPSSARHDMPVTQVSQRADAQPVASDEACAALREELAEIYTGLTAYYQQGQFEDTHELHHVLVSAGTGFELLAISAASAGLLGLMDVANLVAAQLHATTHRAGPPDAQEWHDILTIHTAIRDYLQSSQAPEAVDNLIYALRQLDSAQLSEQEAQVLHELLGGHHAASAPAPEIVADAQADAPPISTAAKELLQLVAAEFEQVIAELAMHVHTLGDSDTDAAAKARARQDYAEILERFGAVFDSMGLDGMNRLFAGVRQALQDDEHALEMSGEQQLWLAEWPAHVLNYLHDPLAHAQVLTAHCDLDSACLKLAAQTRTELAQALQQPQISIDEEEVEPRQTVANAEDLSLHLPADVNQQLLDSLLQELPNQTAEFSRVIGNIISGNGNLKDVDIAQRVAHTLKGSANTVGVAGIANLTHHLEDILLAFTRQKQLPVKPLTNTLQDAADVLEMMSEALLGQGQMPARQALGVFQQVLDWANQIDLNGLPQDGVAAELADSATQETVGEIEQAAPSAAETLLRVSTQSVDESLRLIGESIIVNGQLGESLRQVLGQNTSIRAQSELFQQLAFELEQLIDVRGMNSFLANVSDANFDALEMDQYNELHTLTRRLVEAATDSRELTQVMEDELKGLEGLVHQQGRISKDTQDVVMKTRMLPVQNIIPRLQRSVRQSCRLTGKEVDLQISGETTLIDNDILNSLADPLMHILRNAVDHGIEPGEVRLATSKPENGRVDLSFAREGKHIMIRCQDDGAGLDYSAIREIAAEKGLIKADATPTDDELTRLIFVAGLTTRRETTQMSGRGIGMDAVYNQILRMKGSINIVSAPHNGMLVEIQLPVSLISMHGILAMARNEVVALSNRSIEQIIHADAGVVRQEGQQLYYHFNEERYPAYYLEDLLGKMRSEQDPGAISRPALMLEGKDGKQVIVLVEKILNTQDIVIKKLGKYVPPIPGVEGATILGDGSVASVIDLPSLLGSFMGNEYTPLIERNDLTGIQSGAPKVLVVDDSLSARRSLAEFMQDTGYRVVTARDGIEAIEQIEASAPDILLVDMEMPRMNGLELTSYIRANQATRNLPVIMITSRATEKHRVEADRAGVNDYLVKPYSEDEVLDKVEAQLNKAFMYQETIAS